MADKIRLRDVARDQITGFQGVVVSRHEYLNGCVRLGVQSQVLKDGIPTESQVFDEQQLDLIEAYAVQTKASVGGPRNDPKLPKPPGR